jgi:hypothetical protein
MLSFRNVFLGLVGLSGVAVAHEGTPHGEHGTALRSIRVTVDEAGEVNPWNHLDFHNDPNAFQFAIVSDRTGSARPGVFADAVGKLNLLQPEFVMSVGDLIEGFTHDEQAINAEWDEFQGFIAELEMPFFYLAGNHDYSNPAMARIWKERFGRSYYSFVYRDVLFLCLNSEDTALHTISDTQAQWARETLAAHPEVRWTFVFLHTPMWNYGKEFGWHAVEDALQGRDYTVFAGHYHSYLRTERRDGQYYILASTGGISRLRGPAYGEFDHVAWVTMTSDGPVMAYLLLDGILRDDIRTPESKSLVDAISLSAFVPDIVWYGDDDATEHQVEVVSSNPADVPVEVTFALSSRSGLDAALAQGFETTADNRQTFTLQPKSSRAFDLRLTGELPLVGHQAQAAAQLSWEARLQPNNASPMHLQEAIIVPLLPTLALTELPDTPQIDGDSSDWPAGALHSVTDTPWIHPNSAGWTGPEDASFRLGWTHDDTHLLLVVEVHDDEVISDPNSPPWVQDGIELRLDFRTPEMHRAPRSGIGRGVFIASCPTPGDGRDLRYIWEPASLPAGAMVINRHTTEGYTLEVSIPLESLIETYGDQWQQDGLRYNVAVNDRDGSEQSQLWWQPDWRRADNIPGSGTLFWE